MLIAKILGSVFGLAFAISEWLVHKVSKALPLAPAGIVIALALAGMPHNRCDKIAHRFRRSFSITQPNRESRRAQARGKLRLVPTPA